MGRTSEANEARKTNSEGRHAFAAGQLHSPYPPGTANYTFWQQGFRTAKRRAALDRKVSRAVFARPHIEQVSRDTRLSDASTGLYACTHTLDGRHTWAAGGGGHLIPLQCTACGKLAADLLIK